MENKIKNCVDEWYDNPNSTRDELKDYIYDLFNSELEKERERIKDIVDNYFESSDLYFKMVNGLMTSCNRDIQDEIIAEIDNNQEICEMCGKHLRNGDYHSQDGDKCKSYQEKEE